MKIKPKLYCPSVYDIRAICTSLGHRQLHSDSFGITRVSGTSYNDQRKYGRRIKFVSFNKNLPMGALMTQLQRMWPDYTINYRTVCHHAYGVDVAFYFRHNNADAKATLAPTTVAKEVLPITESGVYRTSIRGIYEQVAATAFDCTDNPECANKLLEALKYIIHMDIVSIRKLFADGYGPTMCAIELSNIEEVRIYDEDSTPHKLLMVVTKHEIG